MLTSFFLKLIKYVLLIGMIGTFAGVLLFYLYKIFFEHLHHIGNPIIYDIKDGIAITFIPYNLYLFLNISSYKWMNLRNITKGLFCLVFALTTMVVISSLTYSLSVNMIIYWVLSFGLANFFIPHLDNCLAKLLKLS